MTNRDMVPRPGPGPAPKGRTAPKRSKRLDLNEEAPLEQNLDDPPDSPQIKPWQDKK